jgi:hypothetical protein
VKLLHLRIRWRCANTLAAGIALVSLALATPALAEAPAGGPASTTEPSMDAVGFERVSRVGFDLLILRPLEVIATTVSLAGALVAYPFALPFGGAGHVTDYLVKDPIDRTFRQPLGDL